MRFSGLMGRFLLLLIVGMIPTLSGFSQAVDSLCTGRYFYTSGGSTYQIPLCTRDIFTFPDPTWKRAVFVIHGSQRTAYDQLDFISEAASMVPGATDSSLLICPQFLEQVDIQAFGLGSDYLFWEEGGNSWKYGYDSDSTSLNPRPLRISSFRILDSLIAKVLDRQPTIEKVIVAGHSGGGQFVQRYAAGNTIEPHFPGIAFRYVVCNPSTYLYFNEERVVTGTLDQFQIPDSQAIANCPNYDRYKFGLTDLDSCYYMMAVGPQSIRSQFRDREVAILLGELDNDPNDPTMDQSCKGLLEGRHRYERGQIFFNYIRHFYGPSILTNHFLASVPGVDHSSRRMFISEAGLDYIFRDSLSVDREKPLPPIGLELFPNPASDRVKIRVNIGEIHAIELMDDSGRFVRRIENELRGQEIEFSAMGLKPGFYLVKIFTNRYIYTRKLILQY